MSSSDIMHTNKYMFKVVVFLILMFFDNHIVLFTLKLNVIRSKRHEKDELSIQSNNFLQFASVKPGRFVVWT